jgi:hypothetical protein
LPLAPVRCAYLSRQRWLAMITRLAKRAERRSIHVSRAKERERGPEPNLLA